MRTIIEVDGPRGKVQSATIGWGWKSWFGRKSPWRKIYANSFAGVSACRMVGEYTGRVWFAFSPAWNAFAANENPWSVVGGSRCTPEESESGRMDTILANPESRILLNIARALNFLPIKPPASLPAFSPLLSLILSLSVLLALDRARSSTPPLWSATPFLELCNPCSSFVLSPFLSLSFSSIHSTFLPFAPRILSRVFLPGFQAG